ncbi:YciI family protein [Microbacterium aerolatum]|uniref:YciI family protein n=1 Tax=Microbacterium aerolatum TaxID=153731 RepID=UPI00384BF7D1
MPQFAVLIYTGDSAHALDATEEDLAEPNGHGDELTAAGVMTAAWAFTPRDLARSIRAEGVTAGPFVDTDQVVAGVYILEAEDWDSALAIARTNPAIRGAGGVEVRLVHSGGVVETESPAGPA